jgi:Protein of unknown function (DUF1524)
LRSSSPWRCGCTRGPPPSPPRRIPHPTTTTRGPSWRRFPSRAGIGRPTSPATASANRGATTSTSSSATTAAIPRDDILHRDLTRLVVRPGTCYAQSGVLIDSYTGESIAFVRGPESSEAVQIDHVVSLSDAWYKGARDWDEQRRRDFANDPHNLLAVGAEANFDKAFRDANAWLPPNAAFRCDFVARQVAVKTDYRLWVSANEKRAMAAVLDDC